MLEINPYNFKVNDHGKMKKLLKKLGTNNFGFVFFTDSKYHHTMMHTCSCGNIERVQADDFYSENMKCTKCVTDKIFEIDLERTFPEDTTIMLKNKVIANCNGIFILAIYPIIAMVNGEESKVTFEDEDTDDFDSYSDASFIVVDKRNKNVTLYQDTYLASITNEQEIQPNDEAYCKKIMEAFITYGEPSTSPSGIMEDETHYLHGYKEIINLLKDAIPGFAEVMNNHRSGAQLKYSTLYNIYINIYALVKYPIHKDIIQNALTSLSPINPNLTSNRIELVDDFYDKLEATGCNPALSTINEALGLTWPEINAACSYELALTRKKFIGRVIENNLLEYLQNKNLADYFYYLSEYTLEGFEKLEKVSGLGFEALIKFIVHTLEQPNGKSLIETLIGNTKKVLDETPEIIKWNHCFDTATLKRYYLITDNFITMEQSERICQKPTMDNFLKVMQ